MVATQIALTVLLLVGTGLMLRSFTELASVPTGFDPSSVTLVPLNGDLDPFLDNCEEVQVVFDVANTGTGTLSNVELVDVQVVAPQAGISLLTGFPQSLAASLADCAQATGELQQAILRSTLAGYLEE